MLATPSALLTGRPQKSGPQLSLCPVHRTQRQDFDSEGRAYLSPVCYDCLPAHRPECPRGQLVARFALVALQGQTELPELWCTCGSRRALLQLTSPPMAIEEPADPERELALEKELSEGIATADSWEGSGVHALTITPALWALEFNWYFLLQENARRHEAHQVHVASCTKSVCGVGAHLRPECPPGHSWIADWPAFTDQVITSIACHPELSWAWEELACWRADVEYWLQRLPRWGSMLFDLRKRGKSERDIAGITGWTRYSVRKRLKWLSWFVRHAADSKWRRSDSIGKLAQGESANDPVNNAEPVRAGSLTPSVTQSREEHACITNGPQGDPETLSGQSQAPAGRVHARLPGPLEGSLAAEC